MKKSLVVLVVMAGAVWWFWGRTLEPARVIDAHLEAVGHGDFSRAYEYLSTDAKRKLTPQAFQETVEHNPIVRHNYTSDFLDRKMENHRAIFKGTVRTFNSEKSSVTFVLVKEGRHWVIDDFRF